MRGALLVGLALVVAMVGWVCACSSGGHGGGSSYIAGQFCAGVFDLPCAQGRDSEATRRAEERCTDNLSAFHVTATNVGCGSRTTEALSCALSFLACPSDSPGLFRSEHLEYIVMAAMESCPGSTKAAEICVNTAPPPTTCTAKSSCSLWYSPPPLTPEAEGMWASHGCSASHQSSSCLTARARCESPGNPEYKSYRCTCAGGASDGKEFIANVDECCQVSAQVEEACGLQATSNVSWLNVSGLFSADL